MMKKFFCAVLAMFIAGTSVFAMNAPAPKSNTYYSPNKKIGVTINGGEHVNYSISLNGQTILAPSAISLKLSQESWSKGAIKSIKSKKVASETITAPLYRQKSYETGGYTEVTVATYAGYNIIFRIYNEGVAYCYALNQKGQVIIYDELADFTLPEDNIVYLSHSTNIKKQEAMAFQNNYEVSPISKANDKVLAFFPIAVDCGNGAKMVITEAELEAYPGMFVMAQPATKSLKASFAKYPKSMEKNAWRQQSYVTETENYIAKVQGKRNLPWRVIAISECDTQLPVNNIVYSLSSPNRIGDVSWVKGGKVAWDWWNDWGVYGVDFEVGINTQTYKYYIDFASDNGIEYIVLDEGWYNPRSGDMLTIVPDIDLEELIAYGKEKNVQIILWTVFNVLDEQLEAACKKYSDMGVVGFKIDFLDRDDQTATEMAYRIAEVCAKYHLTVDYHGYYKPTGMSRTYPNIVNYEAVFGMEEAKWDPIKDMPENDVTIPFIRILCGAVDFTQGGMNNASKENFRPIYNDPMTQGTRCHQLATYIVYDSPLVMLADSPTAYKEEQECVDFIVSIPTVVNKTIIPDGKMAEYIVTARELDGNWYVGGMTDWNSRDITVDFSFLGEGEYTATIFTDGKNADKYAYDYKKEVKTINNSTKLDIHMAKGGGFAITLIKK